MPKLIYSFLSSLDGYVADRNGGFDWAEPDEEVLAFINDLERPLRSYLYGRRLYEMMTGWETDPSFAGLSPASADFAEIWKAAEKVVYSTTLDEAPTTKTRIERAFDPEAVRRLKAASATDIAIGGPTLAAHALKAGLVDEIQLFIAPVLVGGGLKMFPDGGSLPLVLLDTRRFDGGMTYLRYQVVQDLAE
ncbi:dihydrofolate reductase family protein [Brevundimonas sp. NIBR11]|uniref:dihydrofolate reductase family protein n=1 Tax=Brevundimonas sp. NIBR11 TaxID=3015999 RepID=UPI0022F083A5|nr:dihydrofolate reductase family protein [Brevundimonas sp. NIBR11]WGM32064.1 hypothetical protein KKHFBJBL_02315 [Brevundimonas sp. NIBR11]